MDNSSSRRGGGAGASRERDGGAGTSTGRGGGAGASGVGVLDKTVAVLNALEAGPASLAQLVAATGLARPTAHRIAVALERQRLLTRDTQGRFVLGPRITELATAAGEERLLETPKAYC